jgi:hypothetical protein
MRNILETPGARRFFPKKLPLVLLSLLAGFVWATQANAAAQTGPGLITRSDWLGDPYLVTNPPGSALYPYRVCLVMNPAQAVNPDYQAKMNALVATVSDQPGEWVKLQTATGVAGQDDGPVARIFQTLRAVFSRSNSRDTLAHGAPASVRGWQPDATDDGAGRISWRSLVQRWAMFSLVTLFLARRVWRYFHEVGEDDDFADHLATMAVAYRWVFPVYLALLILVAVTEFFQIGNFFFSLSVLALASSLRRYYCEAEFAGHPRAQKVHLALSLLLVWLGWMQGYDNYLSDLSTWFQPHVLVWVLLALATIGFSGFGNGVDLAEVRMLALPFLLIGTTGGIVGCVVWIKLGSFIKLTGSPWHGFFIGGGFACILLGVQLFRTNNPVFVQGMSSIVEGFLPKIFSEKLPKKRRLPPILLLRHRRDHGDVEKAWQAAKTHLFTEERALPVWLFAMETAVLYRRKPKEALKILGQLCITDEFHYDHRMVAVAMMQGWMAAAGFEFDPAQFKIERPPLQPSELTDQVKQLCRAGRFGDAENLLKELLEKDSLNEPAFIQLVRLYCQDMKDRPAAEKLIAGAGETFSPKLLDFLKSSLDEWMRLPIRSMLQPRTILDWFRRPDAVDPDFKKISMISPPITSPPKTAESDDPLEAHLERLRQSRKTTRKKVPDTAGMLDPIEKLLAEQRLGSAVEILQQQAKAHPKNFDLWLRYAEAQGLHCGNLSTAKNIIRQMEGSGNFRKSQIKKAYTRLKKWRDKHPLRTVGW